MFQVSVLQRELSNVGVKFSLGIPVYRICISDLTSNLGFQALNSSHFGDFIYKEKQNITPVFCHVFRYALRLCKHHCLFLPVWKSLQSLLSPHNRVSSFRNTVLSLLSSYAMGSASANWDMPMISTGPRIRLQPVLAIILHCNHKHSHLLTGAPQMEPPATNYRLQPGLAINLHRCSLSGIFSSRVEMLFGLQDHHLDQVHRAW